MKTPEGIPRGEITITLESYPEDIPIKGNAGDEEAEQWVRDQLEAGNEWAWCAVTVRATWEGFEGFAHLGCVEERSEESFKQEGGYYQDMVEEAIEDLDAAVNHARIKIEKLTRP